MKLEELITELVSLYNLQTIQKNVYKQNDIENKIMLFKNTYFDIKTFAMEKRSFN